MWKAVDGDRRKSCLLVIDNSADIKPLETHKK